MKLEFPRQIFKNTHIKNHTKIRSVRIVPCGQTDGRTDIQTERGTDGQRDMKLTVAICNFANAPKKQFQT